MITDPAVIPADATAVVIDWLNTHQHTTGITVVTYVERKMPLPFIRVERFGGSPVSYEPLWLDRALIQIEAFADNQPEAALLGNRVRAAMADLRGQSPLAVVSRVIQGQHRTETRGDRAPYQHRTLTDYEVFLHPNS